MQKTKTNKQKKYKPILPGTSDWPVVQLSKNKKKFLQEVINESLEKLLEKNPTPAHIIEEIESTMFREQLRIKRNPWKVDPDDEYAFWQSIKDELVELSTNHPNMEETTRLLEKIVRRYAEEIAGHFRPSRYRMAREIVKFGFARLLNAARVKKFGAFFRNEYTLRDKIQIVGKTKQIRNLAKKGTIVMVPTHFSNMDSILIGWIIHSLGLPAFIYGAGLNLFNIGIFAYFMNSLGAYKVDRRKKNSIYLETLKTYSKIALQRGAHSLFFPGGTRSRAGNIEKQLKLGLLGTTIEAQRDNYLNDYEKGKKIFIVPVAINYHFVLEAPILIRDFLQKQGQERFYEEEDNFSTSYSILTFLVKFFKKGSDISVSIGRALDVMGNYVDKEGNSIDNQDRIIDTHDYFITNNRISVDDQREKQYTLMLSEKIVEEYHKIARVFASHLAAFTAFEMWRKKYGNLDLYSFLRIPEEDLSLDYEEFKEKFDELRKQILALKKKNKINIASHMKGNVDEVARLGLENVGIYHTKRPLLLNKKNKILTQDLLTLYYYRNRLDGYGLENHI